MEDAAPHSPLTAATVSFLLLKHSAVGRGSLGQLATEGELLAVQRLLGGALTAEGAGSAPGN